MGWIRRHWILVLVGGIVAVVAAVVAVPFIYIHVIEGKQPAALTLADTPGASASVRAGAAARATAAAGSTDGTWKVGTGSAAGYRVHETLAGQSTTAVGRTASVTGSLTISGTSVTTATFTVQMATVKSDRDQRDGQFAGRIMDTSQYPTGTFTLTKPITLSSIPAVGATITATATGNLTLHGTTRSVTFPVSAKRTAAAIAINGDITIAYADYGIANPSFGGFVSVGDSGTIEFLLVTTKS
jgi:polyisoprenoid-binding protein YceI